MLNRKQQSNSPWEQFQPRSPSPSPPPPPPSPQPLQVHVTPICEGALVILILNNIPRWYLENSTYANTNASVRHTNTEEYIQTACLQKLPGHLDEGLSSFSVLGYLLRLDVPTAWRLLKKSELRKSLCSTFFDNLQRWKDIWKCLSLVNCEMVCTWIVSSPGSVSWLPDLKKKVKVEQLCEDYNTRGCDVSDDRIF